MTYPPRKTKIDASESVKDCNNGHIETRHILRGFASLAILYTSLILLNIR